MALVTGASRGIGRACALRLAAAGLHVAAVARSAALLEEVAAACASAGTSARAFVADLSRADGIDRLVGEVLAWRGGLEVLVNNAGRYLGGDLARLQLPDLQTLVQLNVTVPATLLRRCLPALAAARAGLCVNIASVAGLRGIAHEAAYSASKHALVGLSRSLRLELGPAGIGCTVICPGLVATDMAQDRGARLERALQPEDVAAAVAFAVAQPPHACISELVLEPLRPPLPGA